MSIPHFHTVIHRRRRRRSIVVGCLLVRCSSVQVGIFVGLLLEHVGESSLGSDLGISLDDVRFMNPHIIFFALLPILIFESAFFTDVHIFLREMWQVRSKGLGGGGGQQAGLAGCRVHLLVQERDYTWV